MRLSSCLVVLCIASIAPAIACSDFGPDSAAVSRVQSSWNDGERALDAGAYTRSIRLMRSTLVYESQIKSRFTRSCVDEGAQIIIASARAGAASLRAHPSDAGAAASAAKRAWRAYPIRHDCP